MVTVVEIIMEMNNARPTTAVVAEMVVVVAVVVVVAAVVVVVEAAVVVAEMVVAATKIRTRMTGMVLVPDILPLIVGNPCNRMSVMQFEVNVSVLDKARTNKDISNIKLMYLKLLLHSSLGEHTLRLFISPINR
jgi:hypothetical protein